MDLSYKRSYTTAFDSERPRKTPSQYQYSLENQLLMSTLYRLNLTMRKKILLGFEPSQNGGLQPVIRLIGEDFGLRSIGFDATAWEDLKKHLPSIQGFLTGDERTTLLMVGERLQCGSVTAFLSTVYGRRAIVFEKDVSDAKAGSSSSDDTNTTEEPAQSVKVHIALQKSTFDILLEIIGCIDERMGHLSSLTSAVNVCKASLVRNITPFVKSFKNGFADMSIARYCIKINNDTVKDVVHTDVMKQNDTVSRSDFLQVFKELTSVYAAYLSNEILLHIISDQN